MAKDFIDLKNKLARQILQKLPKELSQDKTEQTLYRLSYGCFEISGYKGNLLIEFNEKEPGYGIYYGFMITQDGIDAQKASTIDTIFLGRASGICINCLIKDSICTDFDTSIKFIIFPKRYNR